MVVGYNVRMPALCHYSILALPRAVSHQCHISHSGTPYIHFCLLYCTTCVHFGVVVCGTVLCLCTLLVVRAMEHFAEQ